MERRRDFKKIEKNSIIITSKKNYTNNYKKMFFSPICRSVEIVWSDWWTGLTNEIHDDEVKDNVSEDEVGEGAFGRDPFEFRSIAWVGLDAKTNWKKRENLITF